MERSDLACRCVADLVADDRGDEAADEDHREVEVALRGEEAGGEEERVAGRKNPMSRPGLGEDDQRSGRSSPNGGLSELRISFGSRLRASTGSTSGRYRPLPRLRLRRVTRAAPAWHTPDRAMPRAGGRATRLDRSCDGYGADASRSPAASQKPNRRQGSAWPSPSSSSSRTAKAKTIEGFLGRDRTR